MKQLIDAGTLVAKQWIARALALCVVGPICSMLATSLLASDGSGDMTFLSASTGGLLILALTLLIALGFGVLVSWATDRKEAIFNIALVYGWIGWTIGSMGEIFRIEHQSGVLLRLGIEAISITVLTLLGLSLLSKKPQNPESGISDAVVDFNPSSLFKSARSTQGLIAIGLAITASGVVSLFLGQSDLPGQSVGVGLFAGIAGGLAGAMGWSGSQKNAKKPQPAPYAVLMLGVMLMGCLAPFIGLIGPGADELIHLTIKADIPGYLIVSPIAWSMGALLGVPVGHSWVEHSVQHSVQASGARA